MSQLTEIKKEIEEMINLKDLAEVLVTFSISYFLYFQKLKNNFKNYYIKFEEKFNYLKNNLSIEEFEPDNQIMVLIGTDIGFCGSINIMIKNHLTANNNQFQNNENNCIILIGKQLESYNNNIINNDNIKIKNKRISEFLKLVRDENKDFNSIIDEFILNTNNFSSANNIESFNITYNYLDELNRVHLKNIKLQKLKIQNKHNNFEDITNNNTIIDPSINIFFDNFFNIYLKVSLFYALIQSIEAENYLRYKSMTKAKDEAESMVIKLKNQMNKIRQSKITKELVEIINSYSQLKRKFPGYK